MYAQFELELVGTEAIVAAAERVNTGMRAAHQLKCDALEPEIKELSDLVEEAANQFIQVCRTELWYTPRWWQLHRHVGQAAGRVAARSWAATQRLLPKRKKRVMERETSASPASE